MLHENGLWTKIEWQREKRRGESRVILLTKIHCSGWQMICLDKIKLLGYSTYKFLDGWEQFIFNNTLFSSARWQEQGCLWARDII